MLRTPISVLLTTGTIGVAALAMACGGTSHGASANGPGADNATQPTQAAVVLVASPTAAPAPAATPTAAPAAAPTAVAAPTEQPAPVATPTNAAPPPPPPPAPSTLTIDMRDNLFAVSQMRIVAGTPITMTAHNEGQNMHNWDLQSVAKTPLQQSGQYQVVTFTVQPGTYTFVCDVHPKEMVGTLIAE